MRLPRLLALATAVLLGTAACGGDEDAIIDYGPASTDPQSGPRAQAGLTGTAWTVDTLHLRDVALTPPAGVVARLRFSDDGTYAVATGCNTGSGTFEAGDATLIVTPPTLTKMACKGGAADVEQAMVAVLDGEVAFTLVEDRLSLAEVQAADGDALPLTGSGLNLTAG